jgi:hypothetical protein
MRGGPTSFLRSVVATWCRLPEFAATMATTYHFTPALYCSELASQKRACFENRNQCLYCCGFEVELGIANILRISVSHFKLKTTPEVLQEQKAS